MVRLGSGVGGCLHGRRSCWGSALFACLTSLCRFDRVDKWIWKLHAINCYTVSSAYCFLTELEHDRHQQLNNNNNNNFLWLKAVPLKVLIFAWRLFLDRIPTRDKLFQRRVILISDQGCVGNCGSNEVREHLFITCSFFGDLWKLVAGWLGISTVFHCQFFNHLHQFGGLRGFSKKTMESMHIIWVSVVWTIWKERNNRIFQRKEDNLLALGERVKLQSFWWLKSKYTNFDFDYQVWRRSPLTCLNSVF
jgi:hypothetical protein